jgi:hypothetical protein
MKRRFAIWATVAIGATLVITPIVYLFLLNSDVLRVSEQYARTDPMVSELIGGVQLARLVPYDFNLKVRNNVEYARIDLWLVGTKNQGYLVVELKAESGPWHVTSAELYPYGANPIRIGVPPN